MPLIFSLAIYFFCDTAKMKSGTMIKHSGLNARTSQFDPTAGCSEKKKRKATRNPANPRMKNPMISAQRLSFSLFRSNTQRMNVNTSTIVNVAVGESGKSAVCCYCTVGSIVILSLTIFLVSPSFPDMVASSSSISYTEGMNICSA